MAKASIWSRAAVTVLAGLAVCLGSERSRAGPPLAIDDPGILDVGRWELILAADGVQVGDREAHNLPLLDVSYGLAENVQVSFSIPRLVLDSNGARERSGLGSATAGLKWRFLATRHSEWAVAPAYAVPTSHQVIRRNGPEDIHVFSLPLLYQRAVGEWTALAQVAWNLGSDGSETWDYGVALTHPLGGRIEGMVEVYGVADSNLSYETLNYHLGVDFAVTDDLHLLASFGSQLSTGSALVEPLDFRYYFGVQWFY